jgi:hypothetical protein
MNWKLFLAQMPAKAGLSGVDIWGTGIARSQRLKPGVDSPLRWIEQSNRGITRREFPLDTHSVAL